MKILNITFGIILLLVIITGCDSKPEKKEKNSQESAQKISNRIDIPASVRENLGITFVKVQKRGVEPIIRVPGRFELLPKARREYRATLAGHVEILVDQYAKVKIGQPLFHLVSPEWFKIQLALTKVSSNIEQISTELEMAQVSLGEQKLKYKLKAFKTSGLPSQLAAIEQHANSLQSTIQVWKKRQLLLLNLRKTGGGRASELAEVNSQIASLQTGLAKVQEEKSELVLRQVQNIRTKKNQLQVAKIKLNLTLAKAANLLQISEAELTKKVTHKSQKIPVWRTLHQLTFVAKTDGVVDAIYTSNGSWAEQSSQIMTTVNMNQIRFRATGYQSDLGVLSNGMRARIVPPQGGQLKISAALTGKLILGTRANHSQRTLELYLLPTKITKWARPGVSAHLEIITVSNDKPVLAIPSSSVVQDQLEMVFFRRDPSNPDKVIRIVADLGVNDGRWIEVKSGVVKGDEVVLKGVYELMLTGSGKAPKGGHFHSDGTFHQGNDH